MSKGFTMFLGAAEVALSLGVIFGVLTQLAAAGLILLMLDRIAMRPGAMIDHRLRIHGFPLRWRSKITEWRPPTRFVDEQVRGPYRLWIHEHRFEEGDGGTLVHDHVRYAVPLDLLIHRFFIRRGIERIFAWREKKLRKIFAAG